MLYKEINCSVMAFEVPLEAEVDMEQTGVVEIHQGVLLITKFSADH